MQARAFREPSWNRLACPHKRLTSQERLVLHLVAQDLSAAEISQRLAVNELTARVHIANLLSKLDADS